jgi:hypothetical protein
MSHRDSLKRITLAAFVAAGIFLGAGASPAAAAARFGTGCQSDFQNGWQVTLGEVWNRCGWFNNELDDTDSKIFYFNLHNAKWWWETGGDQGTLDNVSLFYASTHGGGWSTRSVWAMWDQNQLADSTNMRLGDEATGLSILATYSCETLKFNDGKMWTRMGPIFRGGLRYAAGSHDKLYDGTTTNETGEDFADDLQHSNTIKYSWKDANSDWWVDNDATVMATGTDKANCESRRDNMKWQNFNSYPRLRDGQIGYYCYSYWDNL